jgi:hypothetical protein
VSRPALVLGALALAAGCSAPARRVCTGASGTSALVSDAMLLRLDVYGPGASCAANQLQPGAGAPLATHVFLPGQPITFDVTPGAETLVLTTFADQGGTMVLGQACTDAVVSPGAQLCFDLTVDAPPDLAPALMPTPLATDTFHRSNQTTWGTASDGQPWAGDASSQSVFSIASNRGSITGLGIGRVRGMLGPKVKDAEVSATAMTTTLAPSTAEVGVLARVADVNNFYEAYIDGASFTLQKTVSSTAFDLATVPFAATAGAVYTVRLQVIGSLLSAKVWDVSQAEPADWMLTVTDTSLSNGQCGVRALVPAAATVLFTSFVADSY